jgi:hypothetical protein
MSKVTAGVPRNRRTTFSGRRNTLTDKVLLSGGLWDCQDWARAYNNQRGKLGNFGEAAAVNGLRSNLRLPYIVLAAIVGMFSVAGEASACSTKQASTAPSACCVGRVQSACCCEAKKTELPLESTGRFLARSTNDAGHFTPAPSCGCRSGSSNEPAPKPESPTSRHRTDQDRLESCEPIILANRAITITRFILPSVSPPATPLYLRTSRLLI